MLSARIFVLISCSEFEELNFGTLDGIDTTIALMQNLPRKVRDMIYTFAYAQEELINVASRPSRTLEDMDYSGWPEDTAGFLNSDIVGVETAKEAAEIFYGSNTFHIAGSSHIHELGEPDHYNSGVCPIDYIRNLKVEISYGSPYCRDKYRDIYNVYSSEYNPIPNNEAYMASHNQGRLRHQLEPLFGLIHNQWSKPAMLDIYIQRNNEGSWDPRDLFPHILELKDNGVGITLRVSRSTERAESSPTALYRDGRSAWTDCSSYLDEPTQEDIGLFQKPQKGWVAERYQVYLTRCSTQEEGEAQALKNRLRKSFEFPCEGSNSCVLYGHGDCSDHSWHDGWYRAMLHDYRTRYLELE